MCDAVLRPWRAEDVPQLTALWQDAFGDDDDYIRTYHGLVLRPGGCVVAQADGRVVSAMYVMDGPNLAIAPGEKRTAAYTYALATLPPYRGRGIGAAVYKACVAAALDRADVACVLPAEPGLYPFYERAAANIPLSYAREARFSRQELGTLRQDDVTPVSAAAYAARREAVLAGRPHATMNQCFLDLLAYHRQRFEGGLFVSASGAAAAEVTDGVCAVSELLDPSGDGMGLLAAVAARCPAERYVVRSPLFFGGPGEVRPFMLGVPRSPAPMPRDLWWGVAFD